MVLITGTELGETVPAFAGCSVGGNSKTRGFLAVLSRLCGGSAEGKRRNLTINPAKETQVVKDPRRRGKAQKKQEGREIIISSRRFKERCLIMLSSKDGPEHMRAAGGTHPI